MMASAEEERKVIALINLYSRALDGKDWPLLRTVWADECEVDYGSGEVFRSGDKLNEFMAAFHQDVRSHHMYGNYMIDDIAPGHVRARTYFRGILLHMDGALFIKSSGWYDDECRKIDGEWRITKRQVGMVEFEQHPR